MIEVTRPAIAEHPFLRGMPPGQLNALAAAGGKLICWAASWPCTVLCT